MSTSPPTSHWATRGDYDWLSEDGLARLKVILHDKLPYEPADFQVENTARLLMGKSVLCITATGDGKSALFYMYSLVRPETLTLVVSPTNALEDDLVCICAYLYQLLLTYAQVKSLSRLGIPALAINSEAVSAASLERIDEARTSSRDIWMQAATGKYNVILTSPEMLKTDRFKIFVQSAHVRPRLALFCVDECHLIDEWGADFRKAFGTISQAIPWLPDWTVRLALTATLEPGRQTDVVTKALGLCPGTFYLDRRDCQRRNVAIIFRTIQYTHSGIEFRDLDWLVPHDIKTAADIAKTLVYCETIELGHKVAKYLRTLLPRTLQHAGTKIIRHVHSLNCANCKTEALDTLYQNGAGRTAAIHVTTDVLGVGMDVQDCDRVVCFPTPTTAASLIQRTGRTSRGRDRTGTAYVYIKKSDVEAVAAYLQSAQLDHHSRPEQQTTPQFRCPLCLFVHAPGPRHAAVD
jgi:superfamily II DNA helicase RecQ